MQWRLETLYPGIFQLRFENAYDCAMHFLRYQENYESPVWRDKVFTLLEYEEEHGRGARPGKGNNAVANFPNKMLCDSCGGSLPTALAASLRFGNFPPYYCGYIECPETQKRRKKQGLSTPEKFTNDDGDGC
ncbi:hypothetical protein LCGC14_0671090 [marine sediment metagenome]|uniref:Uncharacterized protein n=1 Tax=marine sediment metagenome TaxID=412755 RepID=A0A0F9QVX3_9ZZZZ